MQQAVAHSICCRVMQPIAGSRFPSSVLLLFDQNQSGHTESNIPKSGETFTAESGTHMTPKSEVTKVLDTVSDTIENVKDATSEAVHRSVAAGEQQQRDLIGDSMSTDAKAASINTQAKQTAQADIDAMKRNDRSKAQP
jgi:hypothetical protein